MHGADVSHRAALGRHQKGAGDGLLSVSGMAQEMMLEQSRGEANLGGAAFLHVHEIEVGEEVIAVGEARFRFAF